MCHKTATKPSVFRLAADSGFDLANYAIALIYGKGVGVPKDYVLARKYFEAALYRGNYVMEADLAICAQSAGAMYFSGMGGEKDVNRALALFALAAIHGNALSQFQMAKMHADGQHVPEDGARALMWLRLAADQGHAASIQIRNNLLIKAPPNILAEANRMFEVYKHQSMQQRFDIETSALNVGGSRGSALDARSPSGATLGQALGLVFGAFTSGRARDEDIQERMNRGMTRDQAELSRSNAAFERDMFSPPPK